MASNKEDGMDTGASWGELPVMTDAKTSRGESTEKKCTSKSTCRDIMLDRVAQSDCHFKHQQRGEPDLTLTEKRDIAVGILDKNAVTFLERFGKVLQECDLAYFDSMHDSYEIKFYLDTIRQGLDSKVNKRVIRNRRYEAMKKLMLDTDYFSDEEMKARNPYLYEQLVGQYLSAEEVKKLADKNETLSQMFMHHLEGMNNTVLYDYLKDKEDDQMEESDDEEEEEEIEDQDESSDKESISAVEKQQLRTELVRAMQQSFINGEDDYDYSQIDNDAKFDAIDIETQDKEDKYFDDEDEKYFAGSDEDNDIGNSQPQKRDFDAEDDYETFRIEEDIRPGLEQESTSASRMEEDLVKNCEKKLAFGD